MGLGILKRKRTALEHEKRQNVILIVVIPTEKIEFYSVGVDNGTTRLILRRCIPL